MLVEILLVFQRLDAEESHGEQDGEQKITHQLLVFPLLGRIHRQSHPQAAGEQDGRVDRAIEDICMPAGHGKRMRICMAINDVAHEQAAKKQNLRRQKGPYPQPRRFLLLLQVFKLFRQRGFGFSHVASPPFLSASSDE